eukprot:GHVR01079420.1.p2 GENE.GHVR01079420.1~~GHVR01079420.1.p2  ORF type:complete len:122 (+),score=38.51 GHVR01079420.1:619-984(+)
MSEKDGNMHPVSAPLTAENSGLRAEYVCALFEGLTQGDQAPRGSAASHLLWSTNEARKIPCKRILYTQGEGVGQVVEVCLSGQNTYGVFANYNMSDSHASDAIWRLVAMNSEVLEEKGKKK